MVEVIIGGKTTLFPPKLLKTMINNMPSSTY